MTYRQELREMAAVSHGVVTLAEAEDAGIPAVELRKLVARGALRAFGNGVYTHRDIQTTSYTQPMIAVALAGREAFLHRESVFKLLELLPVDVPKIQVGTSRRVRRILPAWMELEYRTDLMDDEDYVDNINDNLIFYHGVRSTTVGRALADVRGNICTIVYVLT